MRFWTNEIDSHEFIVDRQEKDITLLKQLTLEECQNHFMQLLHHDRANRLDVHWNSKSHRKAEDEANFLISHYDYSGCENREEMFESF
jgi:secreted Zn-dependent insulinase-like peptidase